MDTAAIVARCIAGFIFEFDVLQEMSTSEVLLAALLRKYQWRTG
jgi:hypothetical protein